MPGGDRTGPRGTGRMTGRRVGYCTGYDAPGFANPVRGYGRGQGRGRGGFWGYGQGGGGRGWRHRFYATGRPGWADYGYGPAWDYAPPATREQELDGLKYEAERLKGQLDAITKHIEQFEAE